PFTAKGIRRLLGALAGYYNASANEPLPELEQLTWEDVHSFWRAAQAHDGRDEALREYLAFGRVFERQPSIPRPSEASSAEAYAEGQAALLERVRFFESHARRRLDRLERLTDEAERLRTESEQKQPVITDLERAATERLHVIEELDRHVHASPNDVPTLDEQPAPYDAESALSALTAAITGLSSRMGSIERALASP